LCQLCSCAPACPPTTTDDRRRCRGQSSGRTRSHGLANTVLPPTPTPTPTPTPPTLSPTLIPTCTTPTCTTAITAASLPPAVSPNVLGPSPSCRPAYPHLFLCSLGVTLGLLVLGFLIAAIVYFQRQKKRKVCLGTLFLISQLNALQAWYGQMAEHYRNGGLPPWSTATADVGVGDGSVKAQMLPNNSPIQSSYPKAQYEKPTPFGVHGNLPAVQYSKTTDVTSDESATMPPTPITPSLSPQPQHSQHSGNTGSFEPYDGAPRVRHSIVYARSVGTPLQSPPLSLPHGTLAHHGGAIPSAMTHTTQTRPLASSTSRAPSFYGGALADPVTYNFLPTRPENVETSGSAQGPAYSGGPYSANEYPKDKEQEYAVPPAGNTTKQ
jgi:hypothetical protein